MLQLKQINEKLNKTNDQPVREQVDYSRGYSLCVSVCLSVISNSSGTGGRSAMPLTPIWRALPGELQQLLFELRRRLVREKNL